MRLCRATSSLGLIGRIIPRFYLSKDPTWTSWSLGMMMLLLSLSITCPLTDLHCLNRTEEVATNASWQVYLVRHASAHFEGCLPGFQNDGGSIASCRSTFSILGNISGYAICHRIEVCSLGISLLVGMLSCTRLIIDPSLFLILRDIW